MRNRYASVRQIRAGVTLGMNPPHNGKRFGRMADAFKHSAAYWGECGEWFIVAATHRDADTLTRSNWRSLLRMLGGESETVRIERANHWAVEWVEYLIIRPDDRQRLRTAIFAHSAVADYPILDESDFSELEDEECRETWLNCFDARERLKYLREHLRDFAGHFRALRAAVKGEWWEAASLLPCPSDLIY